MAYKLRSNKKIVKRFEVGSSKDKVRKGYILGINKIMSDRGITQVWLAEVTGLKQGYISRLCHSQVIPTVRTASKICQALGVSIEDAFVKQVAA